MSTGECSRGAPRRTIIPPVPLPYLTRTSPVPHHISLTLAGYTCKKVCRVEEDIHKFGFPQMSRD